MSIDLEKLFAKWELPGGAFLRGVEYWEPHSASSKSHWYPSGNPDESFKYRSSDGPEIHVVVINPRGKDFRFWNRYSAAFLADIPDNPATAEFLRDDASITAKWILNRRELTMTESR